jgi:integrase/recombinase XerD
MFKHPTIQPTSLDPQIALYRAHWRERGYSPPAWPTQQSHLRLLAKFLADRGISDIATVLPTTLVDFQRSLFHTPTTRGTTRPAVSINRVLGTVRGLFKFLCDEGLLPNDPAGSLTYMREPERLPKCVLTPAEAEKIIETPNTATVLGYRDRAILEVLYATGIRKCELLHLVIADINLEDRLLRVNGGKGAKDRVVPLTRTACSYLRGYLDTVRPRLLRGRVGSALFISLESASLGRTTLDQLVAKYARLSGVGKKVTPHVWRHSCATHLVRNNAGLRHVQELLGHRSLTTTQRYLHLTITDLKNAHRRFHPRKRSRPQTEGATA